ncbi:MAG TPA: flavodoxin [Porphyromonadaceae bacterium]|jgi:flavodoxin I|nr:flavodoxin [Porphyromonadaceae bacterium]HBL34580.1 flavodoxin [Porphyromonadaceae bacterium]HBX20677.1 flavodoxin [Porphyromonadaceae bacterium]HCM21426.1 flavodoxin [Porphyromonadaceae bacterium]
MKSIAIIYGSSTDNTREAAELIADKLADYSPKLIDVSDATVEDFESSDVLLLGTSTWSVGELQDDWDVFSSKIKNLKLQGKTIALFGVGDSAGYPDTFVDAIGILYDDFAQTGAQFVGEVSTDGYTFDDSQSVRDGKFVGLALDADNESDLTESRIDAWVNDLKQYLD